MSGSSFRPHESHDISTLVRGGYLIAASEKTDSKASSPLVVGFHGYGENAERHLERLERIPGSHEWRLCAVRALHRFYNTKTGEVIGCWMTSLGREQAIDDNNRYVAAVIARLQQQSEGTMPLVLAGFSQGVAMAYRAALRCGYPCSGLILLAGDVPPDVVAADELLPPILLGRGTSDPLYPAAKMEIDLDLLAGRTEKIETCVFEGGHEWSQQFYTAAGAFLARIKDKPRRSTTRMASGIV